MSSRATPGVYLAYATRIPEPSFSTGVPAFLGFHVGALDKDEAAGWAALQPRADSRIIRVDASRWAKIQTGAIFTSPAKSYLGFAVRGFFENGGRTCYLVAPASGGVAGLSSGLEELEAISDFDLVCVPDLARLSDQGLLDAQKQILQFCANQGGCFAILDAVRCPGLTPDTDINRVKAQRKGLDDVPSGALYVPWVKVHGACPICAGEGGSCTACKGTGAGVVPPCGHVAGVYARTDQHTGVHKAPANEVLRGVFDIELRLSAAQQDELNPEGINCVRVFPGRGIRIWGARTVSQDPAWRYVNVRRLTLTLKRWLDQTMAAVIFEPNDLKLWIRIRREVNAFLLDLFQKGALRGTTPGEAFFVKCDAETNPPEVRAAGQVVAEIGLAVQVPSEFVVARIVYGASLPGPEEARA